jgi:hypothetical protein
VCQVRSFSLGKPLDWPRGTHPDAGTTSASQVVKLHKPLKLVNIQSLGLRHRMMHCDKIKQSMKLLASDIYMCLSRKCNALIAVVNKTTFISQCSSTWLQTLQSSIKMKFQTAYLYLTCLWILILFSEKNCFLIGPRFQVATPAISEIRLWTLNDVKGLYEVMNDLWRWHRIGDNGI